jgi:hypothetical protein
LLSKSDNWAFQSLRLAYVVDQVNDATLRKLLVEDKINQVKVLDNWTRLGSFSIRMLSF